MLELENYLASYAGAGFVPASYEGVILKAGAANSGVTLWKATGQNGVIVQLVEKLSNSEGEKVFHDALECYTIHRGRKWVPDYLGVEKINANTFRVIQIYAGPRHVAQLTVSQAKYLGECIANMVLFPINDGGEWGRGRITIDMGLVDSFETLCSSIDNFCRQKELIKNLNYFKNNFTSYVDIAKKLPLTWANNDIKADHIFVESKGQILVIDWGMLAPNFYGADLHHFYVDAKLSGNYSIYDQLFNSYLSELNDILNSQISPHLLEFGIISFAFQQNMLWSIGLPTNMYFFEVVDLILQDLIQLLDNLHHKEIFED